MGGINNDKNRYSTLWSITWKWYIYVDGYGSTDEDTELLQKALKKIYGVTEGASRDVLEKAEEQMKNDLKDLVTEFRGKVTEYLGVEESWYEKGTC